MLETFPAKTRLADPFPTMVLFQVVCRITEFRHEHVVDGFPPNVWENQKHPQVAQSRSAKTAVNPQTSKRVDMGKPVCKR